MKNSRIKLASLIREKEFEKLKTLDIEVSKVEAYLDQMNLNIYLESDEVFDITYVKIIKDMFYKLFDDFNVNIKTRYKVSKSIED